MVPGSHANPAAEILLGELVYWLTLVLIIVLGIILVTYTEASHKGHESDESQDDETQGWNPVAHIGDCVCSLDEALDEVFANRIAAGSAPQCASHGNGSQEAVAAPDALAARCWALFSERDHALGQWVYLATRRSSVLRHLATVVTLSGDEAFWFSLPVLLGAGHLLTGIGPPATFGFSVELLNDVMMVCVIEMGMKFCVQRDRPPYAPQATFYVLPGEWWSFPSGHSMRGAYLAHRVSASRSLRAAVFGAAFADVACAAWLLYSWAAMVAWSRVAKGRHSPCDVLVGLAVGFPLADLTTFIGARVWTAGRFVAGSAECVLLGVMAARPELRLEGFYVHGGLQVLWFSVQPYCVWLAMSWSTVLALGPALFLASYALGRVSSSHKPGLL